MPANRSVPPDILLPHICYRNVDEAIAWLTRTFGFLEHYRYGTPTSGAQMHLGEAYVMLRTAGDRKTPAELGYGTQSLTVFVHDLDAHYARTQKAGATIVEEIHVPIYGERQYAALDLDGHHWLFSQHFHDVSPEDWGAIIAR